jgi:disulfide bond formation protein DsbB
MHIITFNTIITFFVISSLFLSLCGIFLLFSTKLRKQLLEKFPHFLNFLSKFLLIIAFFPFFGSLLYSDYYNFTPCKLCWFQRAFIYPQTLLLSYGVFLDTLSGIKLTRLFACFTLPISFYHYLVQFTPVGDSVACATAGQSVSCANIEVMTLGFLTIPAMAISYSLFMIIWSSVFVKASQTNAL